MSRIHHAEVHGLGLAPCSSTALRKPVDYPVTTTSRCMENGKGIDQSGSTVLTAIYSIQDDGFLKFLLVETVNKHQY